MKKLHPILIGSFLFLLLGNFIPNLSCAQETKQKETMLHMFLYESDIYKYHESNIQNEKERGIIMLTSIGWLGLLGNIKTLKENFNEFKLTCITYNTNTVQRPRIIKCTKSFIKSAKNMAGI